MILMPAKTDDWTSFPPDIAGLLATNDLTAGAVPLVAIPGHEVPLARGARASRLDLWVLARTPRGLLSIAVEHNIQNVHNIQNLGDPARPSDTPEPETSSSRERQEAVWSLLEIDRDVDPAISHRLIHRTASALLEARRFFAVGAAVIVSSAGAAQHSFADFQRFVAVMGGRLRRPGHMLSVTPREGIDLAFGWAQI
jgi:hypothetical protein